jgi:hypothetical protein
MMLYFCNRVPNRHTLPSTTITLMAASSMLGAFLSGCGSGASVSSCLTCGGVTPPPLIDTTTTMAAPTGSLTQGQPVQFAISVTPAPTTGAETVTLNDVTGNTSAYDVPTKLGTGTLQNGTVTVTVNPPHAGIRTYQVTYNSDGTYAASTASAQVTVVAPSSASTTTCSVRPSSQPL